MNYMNYHDYMIDHCSPLTLAMIAADTGDYDASKVLERIFGERDAAALVAYIKSPASAHLFRAFFDGLKVGAA